MRTIFLRADTKEQLETALIEAEYLVQEEYSEEYREIENVTILGYIHRIVRYEGDIPVIEPYEGYHANISADNDFVLPVNLQPLEIFPETPHIA